MIDYIACILVRIANKISCLIPISVSLWFARRLGTAGFFFNKKRRLVAYANLKAAFAKEKSPQELRSLTKKVYQNLLQTFIEILNLTKVDKKYIDKYVEIVNLERVQNASKSGRGAILLTAHFGDWELSNLASPIVGFPITVLAREQKMKRLNELLNRLRESKGCKVVRKGISTKNILKELYAKEMVGILSDQDAGRNGVFVDFFGRPASTHTGPMEIAKHTDSIILPNFIVRVKGPYHKVFLEEYIDFRVLKGGDDIKEGLQGFAHLLEAYIRKYPDQWLWLHKRWKSTPVRSILVLNDGKAGHLNQSLAVAGEIRRARTTQGYALDDTKIIIVDVRFKNRFLKSALALCASFASWRCHGCMKCMRACLDEESYATLMKTYAEFIVSCGSGLAPVNIYMAKENNAKNIIVMKPTNIIRAFSKFNLSVIPRHDKPLKAKNIVVTAMAPNPMDEERLREDGAKFKARITVQEREFVGLFIGGDNPEFSLTKEIVSKVASDILDFCKRRGMAILATTSRRTSPEAEGILKGMLKDNPLCGSLVIANESNFDETVGGILALSKVIVVSGESVSMVSEAVSSGKQVVVFELNKKTDGVTKHERALKDLERDGYISVVSAGNLNSALEKAVGAPSPRKVSKDREKIFEAVRRLI